MTSLGAAGSRLHRTRSRDRGGGQGRLGLGCGQEPRRSARDEVEQQPMQPRYRPGAGVRQFLAAIGEQPQRAIELRTTSRPWTSTARTRTAAHPGWSSRAARPQQIARWRRVQERHGSLRDARPSMSRTSTPSHQCARQTANAHCHAAVRMGGYVPEPTAMDQTTMSSNRMPVSCAMLLTSWSVSPQTGRAAAAGRCCAGGSPRRMAC
jgi:hypothetical protein